MMRKTKYIIYFFMGIALVVIGLRVFCMPAVCFDGACLKVVLAKTSQEHEKGLMGRTYLAPHQGMLFIFDRDDFWSFWMKNTLIPLDILWLDKSGKIVDMVADAQPAGSENPASFMPVYRSRYVLEVNAGFAAKHGINVGSKARFKWIFL